ncbi:MAG TPA: SAM-dependent chlorinase/fluorinase [Mycobacteriales bacterium]|jgi:S-adenosylmethionine hydrolase|nr:SAM-dependent chlorinase/fluorinase [Mycobacteriales bacterium]
MTDPTTPSVRSDWVTFLSDYGLDDHLVGVCKGVIARIAPHVRIIDVCHQVPAQDVPLGGEMLAEAWTYLPVGVHLALVDPFTATHSRGVAVRCQDGNVVVAPDNGLASRAWDVAGGIAEAYELAEPALWSRTPSHSFRGRDIFAPVAAHLAAGVALTDVGPRLDPDALVRGRKADPRVHGDHVHGEIRMVDHFGNLALNLRRSDLEAAGIQLGDLVELRCGGRTFEVPFALSFGDVPSGRTVVCEDSFRAITIAVNCGRADRTMRTHSGDAVVLGRVHRHAGAAAAKVPVVDGRPSTFKPI